MSNDGWERASGWEKAQRSNASDDGWERPSTITQGKANWAAIPPAIPGGEVSFGDVRTTEEPSFTDKLYGAGEAAVNIATGIPAGVYASFIGLANGGKPDHEVNDIMNKSMQANTYAPKTEAGQDYAHTVGDFMGRYLIPLGPVAHGLKANKLNTVQDVVNREFRNASLAEKIGRNAEESALPQKAPVPAEAGWERANTPMERQLALREQMDAQEQAFADKRNVQGELDLRPKQMPLDENGMPVDMARSLDAQEATNPRQLDMFNEEMRASIETQRAKALEEAQAREAQIPVVDRPSPETIARQTDEMYKQRKDEQIRQMKEEVQAIKEDALYALQEELTPPRRIKVPNKQRGGILLGSELESIKQRFQKFGVDVEPVSLGADGSNKSVMVRLKTPDGKLAGFVDFAVRDDGVLVAENAQVAGGLRGKGAAARMYLAAREAGFDIAPGRVQTDLGKTMVNSLQKKGIINKEAVGPRFDAGNLNLEPLAGERLPGQRYIPPSQRGAINFSSVSDMLSKLFKPGANVTASGPIKNIIGTSRIPKDPLPADVIQKALSEGKDTSAWNWTRNTASGGSLEALTRKSSLIQGVSDIVQNAKKRADLLKQKTIVPLEKQFRSLSKPEIEQLADLMKDEMFNGKQYTVEMLQDAGFTEKQLKAYADFRQLREHTLQIQNEKRVAAGLPEITRVEYGMASRWRGDFRQPVYNAEGKLVWYLAADSKWGLNKQVKALLKEFPDLVVDPAKQHKVKSSMGKNDLQTMYSTMLDIIGRENDPMVQAIKNAMEDAVAAEASMAAGQQKHFKHKGNIRGFVGDRPGFKGKTEALEMFQEQIQYAKNAYEWASMQEAGKSLKEIFSNEELTRQQPKNMEYAQDYFRNNLGQGTAQWVRGIEDAFRELGVSPSVIGRGVGNMKSFFITQKLGGSLGYFLSNVLQVANVIPHLINGFIKEGGNPIRGIAAGLVTGPMMASSHYLSALEKPIGRLPNMEFYERAFKYAEDNGVTSRSIHDESPINQRGPISTTAGVLGKTMSTPETFVRSTAYMMFVDMLKSSKKYAGNESALFQKAEQLTNASMVDYRAGERPMMYSKLGIAGDALNTLQTFPMNLYNQYRYFGTEAMRGNPLPLLALITTQYVMAGAAGVPGFNDLDKLWSWAKESLPDSMWAKVKDFDPKLWMLENKYLGEAAVYGAISTESGVSMTSRLSAPGLADMAVSPIAPAVDIGKQVGSVFNAITDPNMSTFAQAARNVAPTGLQGYLETGPFKEQNSNPREDGTSLYMKPSDLADRQGLYARTPEEEKLRAWGLRSQKEAVTTDIEYRTRRNEKEAEKRSRGMVEKFYTAMRTGDEKKMNEIQELYTQLNGTAISDKSYETQLLEELTTAVERRGITVSTKLESIKALQRLQKYMKERDEANH